MPQPKKIILHIGLAKTGTTSIQRTLRQKGSEIQKHGYLYPSCDIKYPDGHIYDENHSKQLFLLFRQNPEKFAEFAILNLKNSALWQVKTRIGEALISEIQNPDLEKIVFSSEALYQLAEDELLDLKHFFESHLPECKFEIVLFCRHPWDHAASIFQQRSKFQTNLDPVIVWPYSSSLEKFAKIFGKEAISIYKYEESMEREESIARLFFEKIGLPKEMIEDHEVINASMSQAALDILIYINSRYPMMDQKQINNFFVTKRCWGRYAEDVRPLISMPGPKFVMDISEFPRFMAVAGYELNWLRENYGVSYTLSEPEKSIKNKSIHLEAIRYFVEQFPKLNPFVLKLSYDYFNKMSLDRSVSQSAQNEVKTLLQKIRSRHPVMTKMPTFLLGLKEEIKIRLRHMGVKTGVVTVEKSRCYAHRIKKVIGLTEIENAYPLEVGREGEFVWTQGTFSFPKMEASHVLLHACYHGDKGKLSFILSDGTRVTIDLHYGWNEYLLSLDKAPDRIECKVSPVIVCETDPRNLGLMIRSIQSVKNVAEIKTPRV